MFPLSRLTMLRLMVKACWMSRQRDSSRAASCGVRPAARRAAARARSAAAGAKSVAAAAAPVAPPTVPKKSRRCMALLPSIVRAGGSDRLPVFPADDDDDDPGHCEEKRNDEDERAGDDSEHCFFPARAP